MASSAFRRFWIISAKNAVNATLVALGPVAGWPEQFHFHSWTGVEHILGIMASAVVARELMVWVPVALKWSQTETNGASAPNSNGGK